MRVRTLEIRWHDGKPIASCDFQPVPAKKARPAAPAQFARQAYRLATAGEDNHVRLWMVHPNLMPSALAETTGEGPAVPRPPRVEYLATLSRHTAAVNVVRFSPNGELIASAGDDGMIIIWHASSAPNQAVYGTDADEIQFEKEFWKPRTTFKCTTMQVYDLAWSPTGEYLLSGSTDNVARVFSQDGKCLAELAEHHHYVQGVAWDPLNEYIATQSSDRSMHVHSVSHKHGALDVHAVGRSARITHAPRPRITRRESVASDTESVGTTVSHREDPALSLLTPAPSVSTPSVASTPSQSMFPPPPGPVDREGRSSRRSSFSGSVAPSSPALHARSNYARSPSPAPALPAIRASPQAWTSRLYGDESFTNFFRRLCFSPDGALLLTPAGQIEDNSAPTPRPGTAEPATGRTRKNSSALHPSEPGALASGSSVLVYTRANLARAPVAQLPGHKKASVAVRFSPLLYELRPGVGAGEMLPGAGEAERAAEVPAPAPVRPGMLAPLVMPAPGPALVPALPSPALSATDSLSLPLRAFSPVAPTVAAPSKPPTPAPGAAPAGTSAVFALPYRMLFAVATMDTVAVHDTQQAGPLCVLSKLHYDEFTDMSWSPDGQCLIMSSRDGYCTLAAFDDVLPAHTTQQPALQFQAVAHAHSLPVTSIVQTPAGTPAAAHAALPAISPSPVPAPSAPSVPAKRGSASSGDALPAPPMPEPAPAAGEGAEPPKKKRRVALTRVEEAG